MERQIRRLAIGFLVLFAALAVNLNYIQVIAADDLYNNDANLRRQLIDEYNVKRGAILASDGQTELAISVPTGGELKYLRRYPEGELYGHITGFYSIVSGRTELEEAYNDYLAGRADELFPQRLVDEILGRDQKGASIVTTIDPDLQQVAQQALSAQVTEGGGAAVALNPQTGEVLAMASIPSYDPNPLASHTPAEAREAYRGLNPTSLDSPLLSVANDRLFPPGSTFKVVTAAAALESGMSPEDTVPNPPQLTLPDSPGNPLQNFGGETCPGGSQISLADSLQYSCNVAFGEIGIQVGGEALAEQAERFGFSRDVPFDIPFNSGEIFSSIIPDAQTLSSAPSYEAKTAIGQQDVRTNPLHMALVAGAIGNGGVMMVPRLVTEVRDPDGRVFRTFGPEVFDRVMTLQNAATLTQMMVTVVQAGTGTTAQIPGITVAGKTGTAQTVEGAAPHAWFLAFAPAQNPQIAVAVVVLNGGNLASEATGGQVAAPVARAIIEAALG